MKIGSKKGTGKTKKVAIAGWMRRRDHATALLVYDTLLKFICALVSAKT
jgi:hypothetical protein